MIDEPATWKCSHCLDDFRLASVTSKFSVLGFRPAQSCPLTHLSMAQHPFNSKLKQN